MISNILQITSLTEMKSFPPPDPPDAPRLMGNDRTRRCILNTVDWLQEIQTHLDYLYEVTAHIAEDVLSMWVDDE